MAAWATSATPARTTSTAAAVWADWGTTWADVDDEAEYEAAVPPGVVRDDESDDEVVDDE
jgi:hypothetical protein